MLLLDLIFLLLRLLCISEKQPGGSCLSLRAADHRTMILRDKANIRNASDAYVDSIRAETVSICALLYKLLAAVAPERGGGGWIATAMEAGADQWRQPSVTPPRSRRGTDGGAGGVVAAAGGGDQRRLFSILEHSMFLSLRKTDCDQTVSRAYVVQCSNISGRTMQM